MENEIKLFKGDCIEIMKTIPDKSVDVVITDIPYGEVNRENSGIRNFNKKDADVETFALSDFMYEVCRVVKGSIYIFCGIEQLSYIRKYLRGVDMITRVVVWQKTNPSPVNGQNFWLSGIELCCCGKFHGATYNQFCENTVLNFPSTASKVHPTQKPLAVIKKLIMASSNVGDVVLDPCMGSGTTGVACINTDRNFIGIELNEKYFDIAKKRIESAEKPLF